MIAPRARVTVVTVTLGRESLTEACASVDGQTYRDWHHVVLGDGVPPPERHHPQRSTFGFSRSLGAEEPGQNMPDGTPNPLQRWALRHLDLGDFVCFLDDDNVYEPLFLERMVTALDHEQTVGLALCQVVDRRFRRLMRGYPRYGDCDNSAFLLRSHLAKQVDFPRASPTREVCQDCEFMEVCATRFGWVRVPETLVIFGSSPNWPARRGQVKLFQSWEMPIKAAQLVRRSDHYERARRMLQTSIAVDPADAWSLWTLGELELVAGRREAALGVFHRWLELVAGDPRLEHPWLTYCSALVSWLLGDGEAAKAAAARALAGLGPREHSEEADVDLQFHSGLFLLLLGEESRGRAAVAAAFARSPSPKLAREAGWRLRVLAAAGVSGVDLRLVSTAPA